MRAALLLAVCISMYSVPAHASTYTIDIGSPIDELFIGDGWFQPEGPYMQFSEICKSRFRWTMPDAAIRIPVFPGKVNTITMRCDFNQTAGQRLICLIDGELAADLSPDKDGNLLYSFEIRPEMIGDKKWVEMRIQTALNAPSIPGDGRDLRVIIDRIEISADAPARNFIAEALTERASDFAGMTIDDVPAFWKMRYDPIDCGERFAPMSFLDMMYDDSGFEKVPVDRIPTMRRGDAVWYRAWIIINEKADEVRRKFVLPGRSLAASGRVKVWLNGSPIAGPGYRSLVANTAKGLAVGANLIVVKAVRGPLSAETGDDIIERPHYVGEWSKGKVILKLDALTLKPSKSRISSLNVGLITPTGERVGTWVLDTSGPAESIKAGIRCGLEQYGEYRLVVDDDRGRTQSFPVHFLGITFFHWGWYPASGGTTWNGFAPCSNEFLDQLFSKFDDWGKPHHAITWGGAILEPGSGFHLTKGKDYIAVQKQLIADGKLGFVGTMFPPRNIDTDSGEAAVRSMRKSRALYESQLGAKPNTFYSHDATFTPLLPQLMRMSGYDAYCISENWWGQGASIPNSRDCYWENEDGSVVRVMDSWYHGLSPVDQARRSVELGKPAVLCNEEFACLDMTVFLTKDDAARLADEGIFVQPVSLDEYRQITDDYAKKYTYTGDANLCYKGWTGGGEGEFEFEKANRSLEAKLVALENLIAFAKWLGIETDDKRVDEFWNLSLRANECHLHWGNGVPSLTASLLDYESKTSEMMVSTASSINARIKDVRPGVTVFNPLGMKRDSFVRMKASPGVGAILASGQEFPLQVDPDMPGMMIAAPRDLPSCGYRRYELVAGKPAADNVSASMSGSTVVMNNGIIRVAINHDGTIDIINGSSGEVLIEDAGRIYLAKPASSLYAGKLSVETNPLNLDYYCSPGSSKPPRIVCSGLVMAAVECELSASEYPALTIKMRISLADGESKARIRMSMSLKEPTVIRAEGGPGPHEGTYIPGIFIRFPFTTGAKPMVDMAYCVTDDVLSSTNHETFMRMPFRNGTFNALSLAGPNTGDYCVFTKGLPDFFVIWEPSPYMGMSLGMGPDGCPYKGEYVHEYAVAVPKSDARSGKDRYPGYYKDAQSFLVDAFAIDGPTGMGDLPSEGSFAGVDGDTLMIPGIQMVDDQLQIRMLQLGAKPINAKVHSMVPLANASVSHGGTIKSSKLRMPPRSIREIVIPIRP